MQYEIRTIADITSPYPITSYSDALSLRQAIESCYPSLATTGQYHITQHDKDLWDFYHENKDALKQARLVVFKDETHWTLQARPLDDPSERTQELLNAAITKWKPYLKGHCGAPFEEMLIGEYLMRDARTMYKLTCPHCDHKLTSAMPFNLVQHLLKREKDALELRIYARGR